MRRFNPTYLLWSIGVTFWLTICFILPYFVDHPMDGWEGLLAVLAYLSACGIGTFFLVYLIGCSRYVCTLMLPVLCILGSALSFYLIGYKTTLTPTLIAVTLHTNPEEAIGVLSWQVIGWTAYNLCISALFLWLRWTRITLPNAWAHALAALVLGFAFFGCNERVRNGLSQRFPYNIPYTIHDYRMSQRAIQAERSIPAYRVIEQPDSLTVVFILGEALRADHLQLNGYERANMPRLTKQKNLISYPHVYCDQTHTLVSLPYILTRADSVHEEYQYTESSFVSVFKEAGFHTSWLSNQDIGATFSPFVNECDTVVYANAGKSVYVFTSWLDEDLLPIMEGLNQSRSPKELYILHTIGSHWYYNNHVPTDMQYYQPVTHNKVVTGNTPEQFVNSYDNTVLYLDYFIDSVIHCYEDQNALILYQADHGEALGEDGYYLHANEAEAVKHPACLVWYSDLYAALNPDKIKALVANKDKRYRTDYVFYSLLYAAGIEAEGDNSIHNIFR